MQQFQSFSAADPGLAQASTLCYFAVFFLEILVKQILVWL